MNKFILRCLWVLLMACLSTLSAFAQMAQTPLLTQSSAAEPNLVFVFDNSGSMAWDYMFQYSEPSCASSSGSVGKACQSPDVNMMTYDPRILYKLRVNADGTDKDPGVASNVSSFNVYFYQPTVPANYKVGSITVKSGGKNYKVGDVVTFKAPTSVGGVTALGVVSSVSGSGAITGVSITTAGSGYTKATSVSKVTTAKGTKASFNTPTMISIAATAVNQMWDGTGSVDSLSYFSPYTPDSGSPLAVGAKSGVTYPNTADSSTTEYPAFEKRTDCNGVFTTAGGSTQKYCTWANEQQNYANWKLYHSKRVELARTGIGLAFKPLTSTFRLGWGTISKLGGNSPALTAGVSLFTTSRKQAFYDWLYGSGTSGSGNTPSRTSMDKVGQYFSRSDSDGPWGSMPSYTSTSTSTSTSGGTEAIANFASCRRSNMLLMSDGYWNSTDPTVGNVDGTDGPVITSATGSTYQYRAAYPYKDVTSNTLADVAMKYWVNDLQPNMQNNVAAISGINESFWQNVSFYGIGLGVYGTLEQTTATLANLATGDTLWPVAKADSAEAIDDMWHAAVNSRGQFLSARDSDTLTTAVERMMTSINKLSSSQSGVAVSTANLVDGTRKYTPQYTTGSWVGNVTSRNLNPLNGNEVSTAWQVESTDPLTGDALSQIPGHASRNIVVGNGSATAPKAVNFTYSAMYAAGLTGLMTGTVNNDLINYLRGDATNEGDFGLYRTREARLGDIVNSSPMLVKRGVDLKYDQSGSTVTGADSYRSFVTDNASNTEGVLFVGANDGMLHAFRDGTPTKPDDGGIEVFAYVPKAVLPTISVLADKAYSHRYYVDGPMVESATYNGSAWKNVLLGTTGAGAKSVFALDVTDPLAMDASSVLWEVSSASTGFAELGHVLTDVQAGPLPSGDWVAIFGNGQMSASGSARLFVVNLNTGALLKELIAEAGPSNGLGGVRVVRNKYQQIIGAYAGDLKGNLWKFDLSGASSSDWVVGLSGSPLLAVGSTKPITAAPAVLKKPPVDANHPELQEYVVVAGTGKFFETADLSTTTQQTLYGVWDSQPFGSAVAATGIPQTDTTHLVQQTISTAQTLSRTVVNSDLTTSTVDVTYFSVSRNVVSWSATTRGWFINLPNSGERVVYPLEALLDRFVAVDAISPSNVSTNLCAQSGQGTGYVYLIDGLTGAGPGEQVLDTNGDGQVNTNDAMVSGFTAKADGRNTWLKVNASSNDNQTVFTGITGSDGTGNMVKLSCAAIGNCKPVATPSMTIKSREWRQLFMR